MLDEDKKKAEGFLRRSLARVQRSIAGLDEEEKRFLTWESLHHEALLLQAHLYMVKKGMESVAVKDWESGGAERIISLDKRIEPKEQLKLKFKQARKLKGGLLHLDDRKKALEKREGLLHTRLKELESVATEEALTDFLARCRIQLEPVDPGTKPEPLPYRSYELEGGWTVLVGRGAKDNDKLTFSYANGNDDWFHVEGASGAHVVLRARSGRIPSEDILLKAAALALQNSKARHRGEGEVLHTKCKHVSRMGKGQPGKVQVAHAKRLFVRLND